MKLYYISNSTIPTEKAYGYTISKMCEQFSSLGADVILVLPRGEKNINELFDYYGITKNFSIVTIPSLSFRWKGFLGRISFILRALSFTAGLLFFKFEKDAVLYSRDIYTLPILRVKSRHVYYENHALHFRERLMRFFLRIPKVIFATTNHLKNDVIKLGVPKDRIHVAHDAVDLDVFDIKTDMKSARKLLGLPENVTILLYTGSLRTMGEDKGVTTILESLKKLKNLRTEILFLAVGGSEKDIIYYKKLARQLGVERYTRFLRRVSIEKLAIYQKTSDILLMPFPYTEHYAYYMSPLKMFEYMVSGKPIIASDLPSIREVLDEDSAVFISPNDPSELAGAVKFILRKEKYSLEMSRNAYKKVREHTWRNRAGYILHHIQNIS